MGILLQILLEAFAGALLFRVRGGTLGDVFHWGTQGGRLVYALGMGLSAAWLGADWWLLATVPAFWLGCVLPWWNSIDLGRNEGSWVGDAIMMTIRGLGFTAPAALVMWWFGHHWGFGFAGALCPVAYELGYRIPLQLNSLHQGPEVGEALFGWWLGAALVWALAV